MGRLRMHPGGAPEATRRRVTRRPSARCYANPRTPSIICGNRGLRALMPVGQGVCAVQGAGVSMTPSRVDGFLTTPEAARLVGVQPVTIRKWRRLGRIVEQGRDEKGYPLYTREAVRAAERQVRQNGIEASGVDPRQLRRPAAPPLPLAA